MSSERPSKYDDIYGGWIPADADADIAPAVIGADEETDGQGRGDGGVAYVPSQELTPGDENAMVELLHIPGGEVAALAYSSLERLVECCGSRQPWVAFRTDNIEALPSVTGADTLLWDVELPEDQRKEG